MPEDHSTTSLTLLNKIREDSGNNEVWRDFVERYGPRVYQWAMNRKLQAVDAEDVTQEVLLKLARNFEKFEYDPRQSFRGWLRRVTENTIIDFLRSRLNRDKCSGGTDVIETLSQEPARIELHTYLSEAFDLEILEEAKFRVRQRVTEKRWRSWDLLTNQNLSGKEVSQQLGISTGVAYANKNQIQKLIKDEVEVLSAPL